MERFKQLIAEKTKPIKTDWTRIQEILYGGKFVHYDGFVGVDTDWHYIAWITRQKPQQVLLERKVVRCWYCNGETNDSGARPTCVSCLSLMTGKEKSNAVFESKEWKMVSNHLPLTEPEIKTLCNLIGETSQ
jgi:hypothetical protein